MSKKENKPPHTDQHIIPKCYLKAWNDETLINKDSEKAFVQPQVWAYDKITGNPQQLSAKTNFIIENFYTIKDENGERDLSIEHALAKIEAKFSAIRDEKIVQNQTVDIEEWSDICLFVATMHSRTFSRISHFKEMFKPLQEKMNSMLEFSKTATNEELKKMSNISKNGSVKDSDNDTLTIKELNEVIDKPLENIMVPIVQELTNELEKLKCACYYTKDAFGFISSDNPCVWYDPESYKRPPMFQSPALKYDSIKIILPVSPSHCLVLNKEYAGYVDIDNDPEKFALINSLIYDNSETCVISNRKDLNIDLIK